MATVAHSALTDPNIHEPKGASTALAGTIYTANGAGSGSWVYVPHAACYYSNIGTGTTLTAPTAFTLVAPTTTTQGVLRSFTHNNSGRLTYTGTLTENMVVVVTMTVKHSAGSNTDIHVQVFKNGSGVTGTEHVTTANSANYRSLTTVAHLSMATNDYVEIYMKTASGNIVVHALNLSIRADV